MKNNQKGNDSRAESKLQIIEFYLSSKYDMRFNTISSLPEHRDIDSDKPFKPVNENSIYRELEHSGYRCSPNTVKFLMKSDFLEEYNPIIDYFKNLPKYDPQKEPDYILKVSDYIKIANNDNDRFQNQFKKFIVRCVACSTQGVVNKQALVIISSKQNCGKSTFCRWLCPLSLSSYMQENIGVDKDSQIALTENFIINMDELATLGKLDMESLKSFMSKDNVKMRKPYDAKALTYPRIANFVGSTNSDEFLTDVTGSVRWLCFEVEDINWKYSKEIPIDRLWAQAYYLLLNQFKYQLTPEEQAQNEVSNQRHKIQSIEEELIASRYSPGTSEDNDAFMQTSQIMKEIIISEPYLSNKITEFKVGRALKGLLFKKESKRVEGFINPTKGFYIKFKK